MIPIGPLDAQQLLEQDSASVRLRQIIDYLNDEVELIQLRLSEG